MRAIGGLIGLLAALAIGYYIYSAQIAGNGREEPPIEQINLVRIKTDLLALAQAERRYLAANGRYATLEQLAPFGSMNSLPGQAPRGMVYEIEVDGARHFRITARPRHAAGADLPTFTIDETMQITP